MTTVEFTILMFLVIFAVTAVAIWSDDDYTHKWSKDHIAHDN
jgi:hypothetical protein